MHFLFHVWSLYSILCFIGIIIHVFRKELFVIEKQRPIYYLLIMLGTLYVLFLFLLQVYRALFAAIPHWNSVEPRLRSDIDIIPIMASLGSVLYCFNLIAEINEKQRENQKLRNQNTNLINGDKKD